MRAAYSITMRERIDNFSTMVGSTNVQHGKQEGIRELFEKITTLSESEERTALIEQLITTMENNSEQNGFFGRNDEIKMIVNDFNLDSPQIVIDDIDVYKMFFNNYTLLKEKFPNKPEGAIHSAAIRGTVDAYYGKFYGNANLRLSLAKSKVDFTEDGDIMVAPASVSKLKGKNAAMCTERASMSHNLWLIGGYESYYVEATSIKFEGCEDQGHAYCLVNSNGSFKMFDPARYTYFPFEAGRNVADEILSGQPLKVETSYGKEVYANAQNQELVQ